jgi:anti-anti-sigma factor
MTQLIAGTGTVTAALSTEVRTASGDVMPVEIIALEGEFDLSNVRDLEHAVERGLVAGASAFIADLSDVDFLDGAAMRALLDGWKHAARRNGSFVLVSPPPRIWRAMDLIGLSRTFATFSSREEALAYFARGYAGAAGR